MVDWRERAVRNNAEWCDLVSRAHNVPGRFDDDAWTSPVRTPALYPDAVTLSPNPSGASLLDRVDASEGCSIKDSFASIDLTGAGFRVLFHAQWIVRTDDTPAATGDRTPWERIGDRAAFARWEQTWRGDDGPDDVLRPDLLDHDEIAILGAWTGDRIVAGAIAHRSAGVVGISNFFVDAAGRDGEPWAGCVGGAGSVFPGSTLVGYESGEQLRAACASGFEIVGPLQVWIR